MSNLSVNQAAFGTISALAIGTGLAVFAAASTASTVAIVAYAILATLGTALSIASITAWFTTRAEANGKEYIEEVVKHAGVTIPATLQLVAQAVFQAMIAGIARGIENWFSRKISGPDKTAEVTVRKR